MAEDTRTSGGDGDGVRVVLDARISDGVSGGVQQWIIGLAHGFSSLEPTGDEYLFLTNPGGDAWLEPHVSGPSRIVMTTPTTQRPGLLPSIRSQIGRRAPGVRAGWRRLAGSQKRRIPIPLSDGTVERLHADVLHFTFQEAFQSAIPSIYQPWDLQHLHLPQFFTRQERHRRDVLYRAFCAQAAAVVTATEWVKQDVAANFGIPGSRISVVNVPPATTAYPEASPDFVAAMHERMRLPEVFAFYPAQTWPHKNHVRLFQALARLRAGGLRVPLVCSGMRNEHYPMVMRAARDAGVESDVIFLGFVTPLEVDALYRLARLLVFPSLYEGWGLPILEAFHTGLPVVCSDVTSLPELAGGAALLFDPLGVAAIASAIHRVWTDDALAAELAERGQARAALFSWDDTVRRLRALYRQIAGRRLDEHDQALLEVPPIV